jgi:hypothetical protein
VLVIDTDVLIDYLRDQRLDAFVTAFELLSLEQDAVVQAAVASQATLHRRHFPMLANVLVPYGTDSFQGVDDSGGGEAPNRWAHSLNPRWRG